MKIWIIIFVVLLLEKTNLQECPNKPAVPSESPSPTTKEIKYAEPLAERSKAWLKEKSSAKKRRSAKLDTVVAVIPKHLKNDTNTYTHIVRKEYRQMTLEELDIFHKCVQAMKDNGDYDKVVDLHHPDYAWSSHFGVAFLPWHRQYLLVFEEVIRAYKGCENFFVPYWDIPLDEMLPKPGDSALWTNEYWGNINGKVTTGKLGKNWNGTRECFDMGLHWKLTRQTDGQKPHLYSKHKILDLFAAETYTDMMIRDKDIIMFSKFELAHGLVHCFVGTCKPWNQCGGHFACLTCSANDPVFWLLHSFVDHLWDEWATLPGKNNTYPEIGIHNATFKNIGQTDHQKESPMSPFPGLKNIDGFRKGYYPTYTRRPSLLQCKRDEDCLSPSNMLFCHKCGYCSAKVQKGGNCTHVPHKACYCPKSVGLPMCLNSICHCKVENFL